MKPVTFAVPVLLGYPQALNALISKPRQLGTSHWGGSINGPSAWGRTSPSTRMMVLRPDAERDGKIFGLGGDGVAKKERAFEYLVEYPCEFEIKVIGMNEENFASDIAETVGNVCGVGKTKVRFSVRGTNSGRFCSVTVHAPVSNADMLYKCYEMIDQDPRVKFKF
ncbi:unnamed protein product [Discosporangium mesarthrocarpum]